MKLNKLFVFDLESSCFEPKDSKPANEELEIIEIGFAIIDTKTFEIITNDTILIKPVRSSISPFCTELTTLTAEQLERDGITFSQACEKLKTEYRTKHLTSISFGDYDKTMMESSCEFFNCEYPLGRRHINIKNVFSVFEGLTKEPGQSKVLERLEIEETGTKHRGVDDALNLAKITIQMLKQYRNIK